MEDEMGQRVLLLVGTRRGAFVLTSDAGRRNWTIEGPYCEGWPTFDVAYDPASETILAAGDSAWFGTSVWRSPDLGKTWTQSSAGLEFEDGTKIKEVWKVQPAHGVLYAGASPAGLFRSEDGGETWIHVKSLRDHPTREQWQPGAGGLCLHSIVPDPHDPDRMWLGISAVGMFRTTDGGATWELMNQGLRWEDDVFDKETPGSCVHKVKLAADDQRLFMQNHFGVYRSDDGAESWTFITEGLPSTFGFPLAVHPRDRDTAWTFPLNGDTKGRFVPEGKPAVYRTTDAGESWQRKDGGFPAQDAYLQALRDAMSSDTLDPAGVYVGTSTGQVFASSDEGETWELAANYLPAVKSVHAVVLS